MKTLTDALRSMEGEVERLNQERLRLAVTTVVNAVTPIFEKHPQLETIRIANDESYDDENYTFHRDYYGDWFVLNSLEEYDDEHFDHVRIDGSYRYQAVPKAGLEWYTAAKDDVDHFLRGGYSSKLEPVFGAYTEIKFARTSEGITVEVLR